MSDIALEAARLMDMLQEADQSFAYEFIKKMLRDWDPDYTKTTPQEAREIAEAEAGGFIREDEIDWSDLSKYAES
mgnify:CR=1 FL=1